MNRSKESWPGQPERDVRAYLSRYFLQILKSSFTDSVSVGFSESRPINLGRMQVHPGKCYAVSSGLLIRRYASVPGNTGVGRIGEFWGFARKQAGSEEGRQEAKLKFVLKL